MWPLSSARVRLHLYKFPLFRVFYPRSPYPAPLAAALLTVSNGFSSAGAFATKMDRTLVKTLPFSTKWIPKGAMLAFVIVIVLLSLLYVQSRAAPSKRATASPVKASSAKAAAAKASAAKASASKASAGKASASKASAGKASAGKASAVKASASPAASKTPKSGSKSRAGSRGRRS